MEHLTLGFTFYREEKPLVRNNVEQNKRRGIMMIVLAVRIWGVDVVLHPHNAWFVNGIYSSIILRLYSSRRFVGCQTYQQSLNKTSFSWLILGVESEMKKKQKKFQMFIIQIAHFYNRIRNKQISQADFMCAATSSGQSWNCKPRSNLKHNICVVIVHSTSIQGYQHSDTTPYDWVASTNNF